MALPQLSPLRWEAGHLLILDQRRLPLEEHWLDCQSLAAAATAIRDMAVRGAPAIGLAGAYAMVLAAQQSIELRAAAADLLAARPTAVHLEWALDKMLALGSDDPALLLAEAQRLQAEDAALNLSMAQHGAKLLPPHSRVMTICNTGALATGGWGTALGVIRVAHQQGKIQEVLAAETRPWLQGARLTAWELLREQIPCRLLADGAAPWAMRQLRPSWVIVGADRIAANGDTANKIGTFALATAARALGLRFMVVAPAATIDWSLAAGGSIPIEERDPDELCVLQGRRLAPVGVSAWNPVFDLTPAHLIDALVTEHGVICQPDRPALADLRDTKLTRLVVSA